MVSQGQDLGGAILYLETDNSGIEEGISNARKAVDSSLKGIGKSFTDVGKTLTLGVTTPILGIGAAALSASIGFESAFAGVIKTVDGTEEQLDALRQGIRDMAKELPASASEIAGVAEAAGQLGIETESILDFTQTMIDLGESTNLSAEQAATALARLANITQMPQDQFDNLGATIVELGNNLATTEAEIVEMGLRIAGAGSQIGLTEAEILSFAGALSSVGIEAQAGGTAISRVFVDIAQAVANGGEKLEIFASTAGLSADEFASAFEEDAADAVITFIEGLGRISDSGENVFAVLDELELGEIRVRDALLRAAGAGDLFRDSIALGSEAWEENTALTLEAGRRYETTAAQLEMMWNRLQDVAITLGDALVPALVASVEAAEPLLLLIAKAAEAFAKLPKPVQTGVIAFFGLLAVIGPLILGIGLFVSALGTIAVAAPVIVGALALIGAAMVAAFPVLLVVAALAGIVAAVYIFRDEIMSALDFVLDHWEEFATVLLSIFLLPAAVLLALATDAFGIRSALLSALAFVVEKSGELLGNLLDFVVGAAESIASAVSSGIVSAFNAVVSGVEDAFNAIIQAGESLVSWIVENVTAENIGRAIGIALVAPLVVAKEAVLLAWAAIQLAFESGVTFITEILPQIAEAIALGFVSVVETLFNAGVSIVEAWINAWTTVLTTVAELVPQIVEAVISAFTSMLGVLVDLISQIPTLVTDVIPSVLTAAFNVGVSVVEGIWEGITSLVSWLYGKAQTVPVDIFNAMLSQMNLFYDIGRKVVEGIWDGMASLKDWLQRQAESLVGGIVDGALGALGIGSPSKEGIYIGEMFTEGIAIGLQGLQQVTNELFDLLRSGLGLDTERDTTAGGDSGIVVNVTGPVFARNEQEVNSFAGDLGWLTALRARGG